jgi:thiol-disulfide isomerase/thioredoxin
MYKNNILVSTALIFLIVNDYSIYCFLSSSWTESGDVIALTNQNFNSRTKQYDVLLVMFYVKWCSYCRQLHPEYEQAATKLSKNVDSPIYLAKLDCTKDDEAQCSRRYNINSYPTLRIYRCGHFIGEQLNYRNRTTDEIVKTMKVLKNLSEEQLETCFSGGQTDGVKDEGNKANANRQRMWLLFGGLLYSILRNYII